MKRRHRIPPEAHFVSDPITSGYAAEVERDTTRGQLQYAAAQRRLEAAEARLHKAERIKTRGQRDRAVAVARELVELRRQELLAFQRSMQGAPASSAHRSTGERHRPVPGMSTL